MQWDDTVDVAVIGSGAAGLSAAVEAHQAGAKVAVFEKMAVTGGNTRISDGALASPGDPLQTARGVEDSPELLAADMLKAGRGLCHERLVRVMAENVAETIRWTRDFLGVEYLDRLDRFGGHSVARCITTRGHSGKDLVKPLAAKLREAGAPVRTRCGLASLVQEPDGTVTGVELAPEGEGALRIRVNRSVVLATGGYAADVQFRSLLQPALDDSLQTTNQKGATAESLAAAFRAGGAPLHLSHIQLGPWGCPDEKGYGTGGRFASYCVFIAGVVLDPATGERIVNEWADRKARTEAMLAVDGPCVGVVDADGAANDPDSLAICLKSGKVRGFDSLEALAAAYDMPVDGVFATMEAYNEAVRQGRVDDFGKQLSPDAPRVATPPFYAIRMRPKTHYTPGGVAIDERTRVLTPAGTPIPGLFAAGEMTGGVHGGGRLGSCALPECLVFGRIAGREAAGSGRE